MDIASASYISDEEHNEIFKKCPVRKGDILLTKDGANTGNCAVNTLDFPFSLLSSVAVIRSNPSLMNNDFLFQYFTSENMQRKISESISGQAITRITLEKISAYKICLTNIKEQIKIADSLSTLDEAISVVKRKLDHLNAHKKGLMQQLFPDMTQVTE